ncbi:UDP-N-acetylmuramyl-tripeptide synthetase [Candidatus Parcubacteria bacterium]|nr:UDP-N-acetylmuramyl-tripeptide synthetase [Candidatus Parcubacteria bacterium]
MDEILQFIKRFIPRKLFNTLAPTYHYSLAYLGSVLYRHPSKKLIAIGVTGTKGKSSVTEMINSIFETAGYKTILLNTIRWKVLDKTEPNTRKMTIPGRFFIQKMLRRGLDHGCEVAILELSSEAAKQYRHKYIYLDALVFTNLTPEHIEAHGSFENYRKAKLSLAESLLSKLKKRSVIVANADDPEAKHFLEYGAREKFPFSLKDAYPYVARPEGIEFTYKGVHIHSPLRGLFNIQNALAAATVGDAFMIPLQAIKDGLEKLSLIKGRVEFVYAKAGQAFDVVVDYAHTASSLTELYKTFSGQRIIGVLGNTGGGRDKWKRPEMARVADTFCEEIILTNEDPYDEDPEQILKDMLPGFKLHTPTMILDRRAAIHEALSRARAGDVVLITGKGTDPYIMMANGKKLKWSDYEVAKEELLKVLSKT